MTGKKIISVLSGKPGFTVLEVLLAIVIFSIVSVVALQYVLAGDRLFGRNILIENAAQIAHNDIESLKAKAFAAESIEDHAYETVVRGRKFFIKRKVLEGESVDTLFRNVPVKGIEVEIYTGRDDGYDEISDTPVVSFKYLQGFPPQ